MRGAEFGLRNSLRHHPDFAGQLLRASRVHARSLGQAGASGFGAIGEAFGASVGSSSGKRLDRRNVAAQVLRNDCGNPGLFRRGERFGLFFWCREDLKILPRFGHLLADEIGVGVLCCFLRPRRRFEEGGRGWGALSVLSTAQLRNRSPEGCATGAGLGAAHCCSHGAGPVAGALVGGCAPLHGISHGFTAPWSNLLVRSGCRRCSGIH